MKKTIKLTALLLSMAAVLLLAACDNGTTSGGTTVSHAGTFEDPIPLTEGVWANGNIPTSDGEQWVKFTASADEHYIHFDPGTLNYVYVQLYDADGTATGDRTNLNDRLDTNTSRTVTTGSAYYIKVTPYDSNYSGAYQIGFTVSTTPPPITLPTENVITLTEGVWADGSTPTGNGEQWFTFTASADTHYIHFYTENLDYVYIQLYDTTRTTIGDKTQLSNSTSNTSRTVTNNSVYYIRVTSPWRGRAYQIAFNTSSTAPAITITLPTENVTTLTEGLWADGSIPEEWGGEQWFKFTATADSHYIHFYPGTSADRIYVQLYDAAGTATGARTYLYNSPRYTSRTVTTGSVYYIKVTTPWRGTYNIGFTASTTPPVFIVTLPTENVTTLTENVWGNGSIPEGGEQWFKFTASAGTHYIHFTPGTLNDVYVQLYDADGASTGDWTIQNFANPNSTRTVTTGSVYYIKVTLTPYSSSGGAYKIGFNTSTTPPPITLPTENITTLTEGVWGNGTIPEGGEQWFKFTASANTHYIHFTAGTLSLVLVQLYDAAGTATGAWEFLYDDGLNSNLNTSRTVTSGSVYYIKVTLWDINYGAYKLAFNTSSTAPSP
jgi:predicted small secreted protein